MVLSTKEKLDYGFTIIWQASVASQDSHDKNEIFY
jgi:hypothetical protein